VRLQRFCGVPGGAVPLSMIESSRPPSWTQSWTPQRPTYLPRLAGRRHSLNKCAGLLRLDRVICSRCHSITTYNSEDEPKDAIESSGQEQTKSPLWHRLGLGSLGICGWGVLLVSTCLKVATFPRLVSYDMTFCHERGRSDLYFPVGRQTLRFTGTGSLSRIHYQYQSGTTTYGSYFSCLREWIEGS
jgi:hypothetical protein